MASQRVCAYHDAWPGESAKHLELSVFLGRRLKAAGIRRVEPSSNTKFVHTIHVRHRDEVEAPVKKARRREL